MGQSPGVDDRSCTPCERQNLSSLTLRASSRNEYFCRFTPKLDMELDMMRTPTPCAKETEIRTQHGAGFQEITWHAAGISRQRKAGYQPNLGNIIHAIYYFRLHLSQHMLEPTWLVQSGRKSAGRTEWFNDTMANSSQSSGNLVQW